ncbi:MAG: hypothetical protein QM756_00445 [Polyangiaceae bacterium]
MAAEKTLPVFNFELKLPGRFYFPARMTALPLGDGSLALLSPGPIDEPIAQQLAALGPVRWLIAPNLLHHLYLGAATERYPEARVLAPRALAKKRPDLRIDAALEDGLPSPLRDWLAALKFEGAPGLDEFVFHHPASRTLVVTDLVFNVREPKGFMANLVLWLVGCHGRLAQSRAVRVMVKDRAAASASAERIASLSFDTLVMAHGEIVHEEAQRVLARALGWLLPQRQALPAAGA